MATVNEKDVMKIKYKDLATGAFFKPANKYVYIKESDTRKISTANGFSLNMDPEALVTPMYNVPVVVSLITASQRHTEYRNEMGQRHREDGPALECIVGSPDGQKEWWVNGVPHRIDGPAVEFNGWFSHWWVNGQLHREDGPARILIKTQGNRCEWYQHGKRHRIDGPAIIDNGGHEEWWVNDKQHRLDGPAYIQEDGHKVWFIEGIRITDPIEIEYLENGAHILQLAIADNC